VALNLGGCVQVGRKKKRGTVSASNNRKKTGINIDLAVIVLFIISILLFVLIYGEKGAIGEILSPALGGIIGIIKYVIPIGFMILAVCIAKDDKSYIFSKLMQYAVLLSCIAATMSIYQISKGTLNADLEFNDIIEAAYDLGVKNIGGGTVGAVIAYPLIKLLGMFGAAVATSGVVVVLCVFTFGLHPSEMMLDIMEEMNARRDDREAELNSRREQRITRRENMRNNVPQEEVRKKNKKLEDFQASINEDEITINLHNEQDTREEKEKEKISLFGRKNKLENQEEINPDVIEANIYKNTAKANEAESQKQVASANVQNEDALFTVEEEQKENKTKAVLQLEHTISIEDENYEYPPVSLLGKNTKKATKAGAKALTEKATQLQRTLHSFGVSAKVENISVGPAITRYELKPAEGVRVSKIANLADDIALNLAAESIRIEAPIPGKQAVGIEIPNKEKESVPLRDVIESEEFEDNNSKLTVALGKDVAGNIVLADIAKMPHVLIAGSTGSGKSVCINTIITSFIYNAKPSEVKLVMVDPKVVELSVYNGIPHLLIPVVTDPRKAAGALAWAVQEMDNRYNLFAEKGVRDLKGYNASIEKDENSTGKLPQIVIIIDELADLMMVAAKEVEESICRLAQKARAAGMHLVIATQRPSVDVITGLIKANIPSRIAFAVSSQIDSRTILDQVGAEKLLGKGDMLFYPASASKPVRVQGAFVSDGEVEKIVDFVKANGVATYNEDILEEIEKSNKSEGQMEKDAEEDDTDPLLMDAIDTVVEIGQASTSFIQRRFKVGYARAGRIIDQMEARGIISGYEGSKPRQVLITMERLNELKMAKPPAESNATE
jgi:S-DNA-T family DNA segregation ATPase FtsK/SpoIIIE